MVTAGTEDAQTLKNWQSPSCPDSDDNESDYFADDETSVCSSPSHSEVSDTEPEDKGSLSSGTGVLEVSGEPDEIHSQHGGNYGNPA